MCRGRGGRWGAGAWGVDGCRVVGWVDAGI